MLTNVDVTNTKWIKWIKLYFDHLLLSIIFLSFFRQQNNTDSSVYSNALALASKHNITIFSLCRPHYFKNWYSFLFAKVFASKNCLEHFFQNKNTIKTSTFITTIYVSDLFTIINTQLQWWKPYVRPSPFEWKYAHHKDKQYNSRETPMEKQFK